MSRTCCGLFSSEFSVKFIPVEGRPVAFNVPLIEFANKLWVIIVYEYKSLTYKSRSRRDLVMLQYAVIADLI